ncbi:ABC transporter ATP-binding protein [Corynebacterium sp. TAE3-ERU12]|uniref:ABC transporter ATP-binding protein n=1 Tax=Corynebacterium sp. TAE3-ERU12 TaxID=2849491 RepID=UPI001C47E56D|nr:ABC transporter ATP-binding protein [Corynebacterium sp. TAE3-ERU12]MBV7294663.1 ABC transporter ATP-binding protein [Corynebacterium sp. TAE3-ERU12]
MPERGLHAAHVTVTYGKEAVLTDVTTTFPEGKLTAVVGPNGCGKSTLLKACSRLLPARSGQVLLNGDDLHRLPTRRVAQLLGMLPQSPVAPEGLSVRDLVALGRHPHHTVTRQWSSADDDAIADALMLTHLSELADAPVDELSGGQRQRAWIAMALAQDTPTLLLDEPTTYLDLATCIEVLELIVMLSRVRGKTVIVVLHDLLLTARYADEVLVMHEGRVVAKGHPREVFTVELLRQVFRLEAVLLDDPAGDRPLIVPLGRA